MQLEKFILNFQKTKKTGENQYMALCPVHDDKHPSLSIGLSTTDNRILLHCYAGCKTADILSSVGLEPKDLYVNTKGLDIMKKTKYTYYNANGSVAYFKIRTDYDNGKKKFFFQKPNGEPNAKGIQHVLYNLPAVLNAEKVYFVEGEKCADAVIQQGAVATTLDAGAQSHWHPYYNEYLNDKEVIVIPDNDAPGMEYAKKIAQNIPTAKIVKLPDLPKKGDIVDWLAMGHTLQEIDALPVFEISKDTEGSTANNIVDAAPVDSFKKEKQAETMIRLVEEKNTFLFHDTLNVPYAAIMVNGHREVWPIDHSTFDLWLQKLYYTEKKSTAQKASVSQAKELLEAKALFDNTEAIPLETRVARQNNIIWYNLSNENWEAVKITENGWEIVNDAPILFKRFSHQKRQLSPKEGGDIQRILKYVNLQENHTLFLCWLVSCFIPGFPHAMPIFFGEKGAAKTTTCVFLKKLIDPSALETLTVPKDAKSLLVNLQMHWFLPFDNVSHLSAETSDTLCRAITGGGIQERKLFSNADDYIFTFQKCVALNGINNVANRPDLLDRAILIKLSRIDEKDRKELSELNDNFEMDLPYILGGVFDVLSKAMKIYPTIELNKLPRMADFARWGFVIGQALGGLGNKFLAEYNSNQAIRNVEILNTDIVATLVVGFMNNKSQWSGLVSELHNKLIEIAPQYGISNKNKGFPTAPQVLSRRLNNLQSNLKEAGISFLSRSTMSGKEITLFNEKLSQLSSYHPAVQLERVNNPSIDNVLSDTEDADDIEF